MKNHYLLLLVFVSSTLIFSCKSDKVNSEISSIIEFPSKEKATQLLNQEDDFTQTWSQFDIDSRLGKNEGSKAEVFELISKSIRFWNDEEIKLIESVVSEIDSIITNEGYHLPYPEKVFFIKTTMEEEGGARGYTRSNSIILNESQLVDDNIEALKHLVVHELFHILSRNDVNFKKDLYSKIGFTVTQPIAYPSSISDLKMTNPDAPLSDAYLTVETAEGPTKCLMILYSKKLYEGGSMFDYVNVGFLKLNEDNSIFYNNEKSTIYSMGEISNFFEQVGKNTQYIIHPEEILADNFTFTILNKPDLPDTWLIDEIKTYLKNK